MIYCVLPEQGEYVKCDTHVHVEGLDGVISVTLVTRSSVCAHLVDWIQGDPFTDLSVLTAGWEKLARSCCENCSERVLI